MKFLYISLLFCIMPYCVMPQAFDLIQQLRGGQAEEIAGPQAAQEEELVENQVDRLQLAISNEDYPVTAGDIYRITFSTAGDIISNQIYVESNYLINLGVFGELDVRGMNFSRLKNKVEQLIQAGYPDSLPSLTMISTGTFEVPIIGEIPQTRYVRAWGLSRLSDVLEGSLGRHSSIRNIRIISRDGSSKVYDIWRANFKGQLNQNPLIKSGDKIKVSRVIKEIQINGEVYHPGRYQLLEKESLQDIKYFCGGFTTLADLSRITVERFSGKETELFVLDYEKYKGVFKFKNRDIITIPSKRNKKLQVTVVGAVFNPGRYTYTPPENYKYYVNLAGGIDFERNANNKVTIVDKNGNRRDPDMPVLPGDTITVLYNDFIYNFNRFFPVVAAGVAFILTIMEIVNVANQ